MPSSWLSQYFPVNARSVPALRSTWYCSGVSSSRHCASVFSTVSMPISVQATPGPLHGTYACAARRGSRSVKTRGRRARARRPRRWTEAAHRRSSARSSAIIVMTVGCMVAPRLEGSTRTRSKLRLRRTRHIGRPLRPVHPHPLGPSSPGLSSARAPGQAVALASPAARPRIATPWRPALSVAEDRTTLDELCVNTIRTLSMDAVQKANSGHPGTPMALAPLAYVALHAGDGARAEQARLAGS